MLRSRPRSKRHAHLAIAIALIALGSPVASASPAQRDTHEPASPHSASAAAQGTRTEPIWLVVFALFAMSAGWTLAETRSQRV